MLQGAVGLKPVDEHAHFGAATEGNAVRTVSLQVGDCDDLRDGVDSSGAGPRGSGFGHRSVSRGERSRQAQAS